MKSHRSSLVLSLIMVGCLLTGTVAKAGTLSLNLVTPYQSGDPGQTLTFDVNITNNSSDTVFLNTDFYYVDSPLALDDGQLDNTGFWTNAPLLLGTGDSSGDFELFTVTIPLGTPAGLYTGFFAIYGDDGGSSVDSLLGTAYFDINVLPEPSSLVLFVSGLAVLAGIFRRRLIRVPARY